MKRFFLVLTLSGLFAGALRAEQCSCGNKQCGCECNILTVDMAKVYNSYGKAEQSREKFQKKVEKVQDEFRTMLGDGIEMAKKLRERQEKANNPALSDSAKEKYCKQTEELIEEIRKKEAEVNEFRQARERQLCEEREESVTRHINEIKGFTAEVAKESGAAIVLNSAGIEVLYYAQCLDVTEKVIARSNAEK
ncbi:MAG: OmpH family outer membrane protein [Puniceicoccales bacterium]|jgi:Skp family chaperone for outer membrane proteins|nr:OmpH family outer membrane protein [Puniceicoccales bacterium]